MFGKPFLNSNAHRFSCERTARDMQAIADDETLPENQRLLARQCRDLATALHTSLKESSRG